MANPEKLVFLELSGKTEEMENNIVMSIWSNLFAIYLRRKTIVFFPIF